jgi:hypothetical protein
MASAVIIDDTLQKARVIKDINHPITNIIPVTRGVRINEVLPFRVRFTTIGLLEQMLMFQELVCKSLESITIYFNNVI